MKRRWLLLIPAVTFAMSTASLLRGDFAQSDLPRIVLPQHAIANGLEALGWLAVLLLYAGKRAAIAGRIALFLIGMWLWDMVTTLPITLPVPPYQAVWGPFSLLLLIYAVQPLLHRPSNAQASARKA